MQSGILFTLRVRIRTGGAFAVYRPGYHVPKKMRRMSERLVHSEEPVTYFTRDA